MTYLDREAVMALNDRKWELTTSGIAIDVRRDEIAGFLETMWRLSIDCRHMEVSDGFVVEIDKIYFSRLGKLGLWVGDSSALRVAA